MTQPPRPPQGPRQGSSGDERTVITGGNFGKSVPARVPGRSVPPARPPADTREYRSNSVQPNPRCWPSSSPQSGRT